MDSIQSEAVWKTILRQIRQTSFSEDKKIFNIDHSLPRKHSYSFSGIFLNSIFGCIWILLWDRTVLLTHSYLRYILAFIWRVYSNCFKSLSCLILRFTNPSKEHPIDFVNTDLLLINTEISNKPFARIFTEIFLIS